MVDRASFNYLERFRTTRRMIAVHTAMYGDAGQYAAQLIAHWAPRLFSVKLDPREFRVLMSPFELGSFNQLCGFYSCFDTNFIGVNRRKCACWAGRIIIGDPEVGFVDHIIHGLTHARQKSLMGKNRGSRGWKVAEERGTHLDRGWYQAVSEACPKYLDGVTLPESIWPKRGNRDTLTEVEFANWPASIRELIKNKDRRLVLNAE